MRRIRLAVVLTLLIILTSLAAEAQQPGKTHRVLTGGSEAASQTRLEAFRKALRELGYVGDRSITWE